MNADRARTEPDYANNRYPATGTVDLDFQARRSLGVGYFLVDYHPKPSQQYGPYQGPAQANAAWAASPAASGLLYRVYPTGSLAYDNLGVFKYSGTDVRDLYTPPGGQGVCGHCELFWELFKRWLALQMTACLDPADCLPKPDVVFGWLPPNACEVAPFVGLADSTTKKVALGAAGLPHDVLAHEVGHLLGLKHAKCQSSGDPFEDPAWPYMSPKIQQVGFDVGNGVAVSAFAASDLMAVGNCKVGTEWISPYHWNKLFSALAPSSGGQSRAVALQETYALVSGLINADGTGRLDPLFVLSSGAELPAPEGGPYCLVFYGASGAWLGRHCFSPDFSDPISGGTGSVAYFAYALPLPEGAVRLALQRDEMVVAQRSASSRPPEVRFTSPAGGETWDATHRVTWVASDPDGDTLTFALFYSHDGGGGWQPVELGFSETSLLLATSDLPGGEMVRLRVLASDGFRTTAADSPAFRVPAKAPMAHIAVPADGSVVAQGHALILQGHGQDLEAALPEAALSWWSGRDGLLGRGDTLIVPGLTLSPGEHTISLCAQDRDGQIGSAEIRILVGQRISLPSLLRGR